MSNTDKRVYMDAYNLQNKWLNDIASKYFELDNENLLRVGLLGYVNEVMSNSVEETNFMTNLYYNEIIPIRANLPDSIYAYASQVKFDSFTASPATLNFIIAIRKNDIINCKSLYRLEGVSEYENYVVLEKNSYLELENGKYRFYIEYDIQIDVKENSKTGEVFLTSRYIKDRINNVYEYIPTTISKMNGEEFLFLSISGKELTYKSETFTVFNNDVVSTTSFEVKFEGQLSHFDVYYKPNMNKDEVIPLTKYFLDELEPDEGTKFCFYRYINETTVEIFFSPYNGYFKPEFNSQIIVDLYTTQGSKGNFHFSGTDSAFYPSNSHYTQQNMYIIPYISEPSTGGEDIKDLANIKKKVIDQFSVRHNIITESDLNKFFNDTDKESEVLFVKRRDDIFKRIFSAFILAKDESNNIIPTNTVRLEVPESAIDIKNTDQGIYMFKSKKIVEKGKGLFTPEESLEEAPISDFSYVNTTLIKFNLSPLSTVHYNTYKNEYISLDFAYSNSQSLNEFIINDVNIYRDPAYSDKYELKFELASSLDTGSILKYNEETQKYQDTQNIKIKGILSSNKTSIGYIDFIPIALNHETQKIVYRAVLKSSDYIDNGDRIGIINSIKNVVNGEGVYKKDTYLEGSGVSLEICVFYKNGTTNKNDKLSQLTELTDYCLANSFRMREDLILFTNLDRMMYTNVKVDEREGELTFTCDSIPVVSYDYFTRNGSPKIFNILKFFSSYLKKNLNKLENNFDVDIKFFNTYGSSKWFTVGLDKEKLDAVNIKIKLRIKTSIFLDIKQKESIRDFIKDYLESINNDKIRNIYISNLIRMLENEFPYITFVEFLGFNDYDTNIQSLESVISDLDILSSSNDILDYVPEYLNLNKLQNNNGEFEPDIYIEYI